MNSKEICLATIHSEKTERIPIFPLIMSFAAKNLGISYREFSSNGKLLAEAQCKSRELFGLDAITACSDAFRISADLGGEIIFPEAKPPYVQKPLVKDKRDLSLLKKPDVDDTNGRMFDRVKAVKEMVNDCGDECLVLGWVDMPFAEACSLCGVSEFMVMMYLDPILAHAILDFLTDIVIDFATAQIKQGAPMIGAGDAAASMVSPELFTEFCLPYEKKVCEAIHKEGGLVKLHICGNTTSLLPIMIQSGADLFNIDHLVDFESASNFYGSNDKAFKGNLDPVGDILQATPEECRKKARACIRIAEGKNYFLSAGCEIPAEVSYEVFKSFCESVYE